MIILTRLNKSEFMLNPDLILTVEATPDTVITLSNDEKLIVTESPENIVERIIAFRRRIFSALLAGDTDAISGILAEKNK